MKQEQYLAERLDRSVNFNNETLDQSVLEIITQVRKKGDDALYSYTEKFDGVTLDSLSVTSKEISEARKLVNQDFIQALEQAKENITRFHEAQKEQSWSVYHDDGRLLGQQITPIEKVGVYVPGGKAAYPSTVLMNVIPAKLAGVNDISIVTPPQADGKINPCVLVAAQVVGVDNIYKIGGAQAIAALAYGTQSIGKVGKIVGPGNAYVARAKKWVFGDVAIDMIAGPSEICVVADETANPSYVASDLLSQAEHDEQASSICITTSDVIAQEVKAEIQRQVITLDRNEIIQKSLTQNGKIIVVQDLNDVFELVNDIAPEHLQLMIQNPAESMHAVKHAGAIFLGNYSPEPLGDYFAGPNHTLPTNGTAIFSSPLGVYDFVKKTSIIQYGKNALLNASDSIITLAKAEGLTAHANSVQIRKDEQDASTFNKQENS
ncbi:histidinol dehydrogenase [Virgibacillus ndiopensis]|uniref:histidinol dehydrogenase n=1 Tax=Virgibacillus ndiopensis TaxID=2004408 RepID=UPI003CCC4204